MNEDKAFEELFTLRDVPDEGFSDGVIVRVQGREKYRGAIIAAGAVLGSLAAFQPVYFFSQQLSNSLLSWASSAPVVADPTVTVAGTVITATVVLIAVLSTRLLEN